MKRKRLILAAALVTVANAVSLIGAGWNRARKLQTIELTERELPIGYRTDDNSGIDVRLTLANEGAIVGLGLEWLDAAKLRELGFDTNRPAGDNYWQVPPRQAYLALEFDGPAWQRYLDEARKVSRGMDLHENTASHLVAVDAARTPEVLLARYGKTGRHLVVRATLAPMISSRRKDGSMVEGRILDIMPREIHVPLRSEARQIHRYTLRLAYGVHYEPWVESVAVQR